MKPSWRTLELVLLSFWLCAGAFGGTAQGSDPTPNLSQGSGSGNVDSAGTSAQGAEASEKSQDVGPVSADSFGESARPRPAPRLVASAQGAEASEKSQDVGPVVFSPQRPLFAPLLGDPREPSIGFDLYASEKGTQSSLGGTLELLRWRSARDMEWGWGIFAGLWLLAENPDFSLLEADDWFSGTYISERTGAFSFRIEFQDQKSDLGDSLFGQQLILFTRDNFNLSVSLDASSDLRFYAGGGLRYPWDDFMKSQSQAFLFCGFEAFSAPFSLLGSTCRGYGTYHFKYQDQAGGTFDHEAQLGLQWKTDRAPGGFLRLSLVYYGGRSEFGEFFQQYDQHGGVALFYDP